MNNSWKKAIVLVTLTTVSFSAFAQRRGNRGTARGNGSLEQVVQDKIVELNFLTSKIERSLGTMRPAALNAMANKLEEAIQIIKSRGTTGPSYPAPTPLPTPTPIPGPHLPPHRGLITVTGSIENKPFMFDVTDAADLAAQCVAANQNRIVNVDEINISVDFGPSRDFTTSGWWRGEGEACAAVADKAIQMGLPQKMTAGFFAVGSVEGKSFMLEGYTLRDVMVQCTEFHRMSGIVNADEMTVFNGHKIVTKKTSGWWSNSGEVCNTLIQAIQQ